jgi:hypothetical protein
MKRHAWSWSRLNTFEQCPRKFYLQNVSKELKYVQSDAAKRGEALHAMLEHAAIHMRDTGGVSFKLDVAHMIPLTKALILGADEVLIEEGSSEKGKYALDGEFNKVGYFSKKAWLRFGIDLAVKRGSTAVIVDWKTGRNYGYTDQLKLFAAICMELIWPDVDEITAGYVYIDQKETSKRVFKREDLDDMWDDLINRASAIDRAHEQNDWPPRQNNFCKWCDANPNQCPLK